MGGKSSKPSSGRRYSPYDSSSSWNQYGYPQASPYPVQSSQQHQYYTPPHHREPLPTSSYNYEPERPQLQRRRLDRKYSRIADNYQSLDEVTQALAQSGLESSNLIVGIDFTKSNEWTGSFSSLCFQCLASYVAR
uniref:Uncharacterized protein MANES_13G021000 n=1 Tax=Rhizophora mucronata TaxID=61149 RepID=A0A2P2LX45_RHIMU